MITKWRWLGSFLHPETAAFFHGLTLREQTTLSTRELGAVPAGWLIRRPDVW